MNRTPSFTVSGRRIGPETPPFVIAEISGNHNGDLSRALRLIEAAHAAGADAVKLQTYTADTITINHDSADFRISSGLWKGHTLYSLYQLAHTPWEWHPAMFELGKSLGIPVFSTPFDESAVHFLEQFNPPAYKIASFECTDIPLIKTVAKTGRPLFLSTGIATFDEIFAAIEAAQAAGAPNVLPFYCVSSYPAPVSECNLRTLQDMASRTTGMAGLSDHTLGHAVATASVALGAVAIEKHLTICRADGGPDAEFSLEPAEFSQLVKSTRDAWSALGAVTYEHTASEAPNIVFRRSLYIVQNIKRGEHFTSQNLRAIRPGYGLPPSRLQEFMGKRASRDIAFGTPLGFDMVDSDDFR